MLILLSLIQLNKLITIPHRIQKLNEVLILDDDGGSIIVGMEAQPWGVLQILVDENMHVMLFVVDQAEGGDAAGFQAEILVHTGL